MNRKALALPLSVLALILACQTGPTTPRVLNLYPTPSPQVTQTPFVIVQEITITPPTPIVVQITLTPDNPTPQVKFCASATLAVYLRPSPGIDNYPIVQVPNGAEVVHLGGKSREWMFVEYSFDGETYQGWINKKYLEVC